MYHCLHQQEPSTVSLCWPDLAPCAAHRYLHNSSALVQVLGLFHSALQCQGVLVPDEHHPGRFEILFTETRSGSRWGLLQLAASQSHSSPMFPPCRSATDKPIRCSFTCLLLQGTLPGNIFCCRKLCHKCTCWHMRQPCRDSPAETQRQAPAPLGMQG